MLFLPTVNRMSSHFLHTFCIKKSFRYILSLNLQTLSLNIKRNGDYNHPHFEEEKLRFERLNSHQWQNNGLFGSLSEAKVSVLKFSIVCS